MVQIGSPPPRPTGRLPPRVSAADLPDQQPPPHHRGADLSRDHPGDQEPAHYSPYRATASSATADIPCSNNFDAQPTHSPGRTEVERRLGSQTERREACSSSPQQSRSAGADPVGRLERRQSGSRFRASRYLTLPGRHDRVRGCSLRFPKPRYLRIGAIVDFSTQQRTA
jgi:hypothetical protein